MRSKILAYSTVALLISVAGVATIWWANIDAQTDTVPAGQLVIHPDTDDRSMTDLIVNTSNAAVKGDLQTLYQIKKGDSLFRISQKFGVSVQAIKDANRDKNNVIVVDQWIVIPK